MYVEEMLEKYKDWDLLRIFLNNPDRGFYTKELSRKTGIGSGTVNKFLRNIHKDKILTKDIIGNVHLYRLNNELEIVKQLKIFNNLIEFKRHELVKDILRVDDTIISIILYGSYANGENDSKSDIDFLLITNKKKEFTETIQKLENKLKKTVSIQVMTLADWQKLKQKDKIFYESILEKHIILYGSELP